MDHNNPVPSPSSSTTPNEFCDICGSVDRLNSVRRAGSAGPRTCHACRNFYNRWRKEYHELQCRKENNCEINAMTRKACNSCRFQKFFKGNSKYVDIEQWSPVEESATESINNGNNQVSSSVDGGEKTTSSSRSLKRQKIDNDTCEICGDYACGRNYGVLSCNGCTKFFRRQTTQPTGIPCLKQGCCLIDAETRNNCKFCRLQKCLLAGMRVDNKKQSSSAERESESPADTVIESVDSISGSDSQDQESTGEDAYDPLEKHLDYQYDSEDEEDTVTENVYSTFDHQQTTIPETTDSPGPSNNLECPSPLDTLTESAASTSSHCIEDAPTTILEDTIRVHKESCAFTMDKVSEVLNGNLIPANIPSTNHLEAWNHFAPIMDLEIREIFYFLGNLHFLKINHQQTVALLKNSAFKIYLLRVIRSLFPQGMVLRDGRVIDCQILNFIFGEQIVTEMLQISNSIRYAVFVDDQLPLFIVMVFLESQGKFVEEIRVSLGSHQALMDLRPKLDTINHNFMNSVVPWLRANHKSVLLPRVFSEVFDIPLTIEEVENVNPQEVEKKRKA